MFSTPRRKLASAQRRGPVSTEEKIEDYLIGYLHVDFAEVRTEESREYLFVTIDRTSEVAFVELKPRATRMIAADFMQRVLENLPCNVHTVLTDNDMQFSSLISGSQESIALTAFAMLLA